MANYKETTGMQLESSRALATFDEREVMTNAKGEIIATRGGGLSRESIELIKRTVCRGASDDELALFVGTANRLGLDPFTKQIHAVKRWNSESRQMEMAIQIGIDGFRLCADRTGRYMPGDAPTFTYEGEKLVSAKSFVKRWSDLDRQWHVVEAEAYYDEYVQTTKDGRPTSTWAKMPHVMLAKCAESLALRKAFPRETGGMEHEAEGTFEVEERKNPIDVVNDVRKSTTAGGPVYHRARPDAPILNTSDTEAFVSARDAEIEALKVQQRAAEGAAQAGLVPGWIPEVATRDPFISAAESELDRAMKTAGSLDELEAIGLKISEMKASGELQDYQVKAAKELYRKERARIMAAQEQ